MRWLTHQSCAVGIALCSHMSWIGVCAAFFGGILPDIFDQKMAKACSVTKKGQQRVFGQVHRGISHWFGLYVLLILALDRYMFQASVHAIILGLAIGALSHVLLDMLTPKGVPLLPLSKKWRLAIPVCSTGSVREYMFLVTLWVGFLFLLRHDLASLLDRVAKFLRAEAWF